MVVLKIRLFEFWGFVETFFFIIFCCFSVWVYYTHIQLWCPHFIAAAIGCFRYFTCLKFLSPNIHMQILLIDFLAFPSRINWESLVKDQSAFPVVMILLILLAFSVNDVWILWGENWCWSLLAHKKGLKSQQDEWSFICPSYF